MSCCQALTYGSDRPIILIGFFSLSQMLSDRYPLSQGCERFGESFFAIDFDVVSLFDGVWRSETLLE